LLEHLGACGLKRSFKSMVRQFLDGYEECVIAGGAQRVSLVSKFRGFAASCLGKQNNPAMFAQLRPFDPAADLATPNPADLKSRLLVLSCADKAPLQLDKGHLISCGAANLSSWLGDLRSNAKSKMVPVKGIDARLRYFKKLDDLPRARTRK
jgi:hypothetical protein